MAQLTVNKLSQTKTAQTLVAAAGGGDSWANTGKEQIAVKNAGGGAITLTVKCNGGDGNNKVCNFNVPATPGHDVAQSIPNDSAIYVIGPFPTYFNDGSGLAQITYSGVTSVTIGIFAQPPQQ
jgi:hypothetical protein